MGIGSGSAAVTIAESDEIERLRAIERAVKEWRDARQVIFDAPPTMLPRGWWKRLGNAEAALMALAREIA
jgi:predicted nuclease with RNAse H fold